MTRRLGRPHRRAVVLAVLAAGLASLGATPASGNHVAPTVRDLDMANLGQNERELNITVDPNNPNHLAAGANQRSGTQRWYTSTDGGRNWSNGALPNGTLTVAGSTNTTMSDPSLDFGSNGEIYYSALMHDGSAGGGGTLFVSESGDDGANWTDPNNGIVATGTNNSPKVLQDKEHILVDRAHNDNVYVAWTPIGGTNDQEAVFSRDLNGVSDGFSFSAPTVLSTLTAQNGCLNQGADFAISGNRLWVAYTSFCSGFSNGDAATVYVQFSDDQGANWSTPVAAATLDNVDFTSQGFRSRSHPSIDADPTTGRAFVVYATYADTSANTNAEVNIVSSTDGTTWTSPTRVNQDTGTSDQWMPWIDVANGNVYVDYYTRSEGSSVIDLHLSYGAVAASPSFTEVDVTSTSMPTSTGFLGDYIGIIVGSDGVAHPAWGDGRSGVGGSTDAYTARVDFSPPSAVALAPLNPTVEVGNPAAFTATVTGAHGEAEQLIPITYTVTSSGSPSSTGTSGTSNASGQLAFSYTNTKAAPDTLKVWADLDEDGTQDAGEVVQTTVNWKPGPPATLVLAPKTANTPVTSQHCVTATEEDKYGNRTPGISTIFTVAGAVPTSGTVVTDGNGQAQFCHSGPTSIFAPTGVKWAPDSISAFADTDSSGTQNGTEPGDTASNTWVAGAPVSLALSPATAANTVGTQHCVGAIAKDTYGNPTQGVSVVFAVTGANTAGSAVVADANGFASFCYTGTTAGNDTITAFADTDLSGTQTGSEPSAAASATWCTRKCK